MLYHFTLLPIPDKALKQERFVSNKWIDFTLVPFFHEQHNHFSVLLLLTNSSNPWINIQCNCLLFLFCALIHIYVGLIHTMGKVTLKDSFFKHLFAGRASDCSALLFSPLQLAGLHVNMVKIRLTVTAHGVKGQTKATSDTNTSSHTFWRRMVATYLLPPTLFCLKAFFILLCYVVWAFSRWKCLPLPFNSCPFYSTHLYFSTPPPFCPPQHMLDLHVPLTLLPVCFCSLGC